MRHIWGIFFLEKHLKSVLNVRCYVKQPLNLEDLHTLNSLAARRTQTTLSKMAAVTGLRAVSAG